MTNKPLICLCRNRFGTRGLFGDGGEADQKQESSCGRRIQASSMHRKSNTFQPLCNCLNFRVQGLSEAKVAPTMQSTLLLP